MNMPKLRHFYFGHKIRFIFCNWFSKVIAGSEYIVIQSRIIYMKLMYLIIRLAKVYVTNIRYVKVIFKRYVDIGKVHFITYLYLHANYEAAAQRSSCRQ